MTGRQHGLVRQLRRAGMHAQPEGKALPALDGHSRRS